MGLMVSGTNIFEQVTPTICSVRSLKLRDGGDVYHHHLPYNYIL
jgi:hypothetical protein